MKKEFSVRVKNLSIEHRASVYSGNNAFGFHFLGKQVDFNKVRKYVEDRPILILETFRYSSNDLAKTIFSKTFKGEPNNCLLVQLANSADKKEISKIQYDVARVALTQIEEQD